MNENIVLRQLIFLIEKSLVAFFNGSCACIKKKLQILEHSLLTIISDGINDDRLINSSQKSFENVIYIIIPPLLTDIFTIPAFPFPLSEAASLLCERAVLVQS